jgi:ATP-binding cassette subfamily B (MDR/TAP) protein 1
VFEIIDRKTEIDADVVDAEKLTKVEGQVELKNVSFAYPSRPDIMVLKGFNLKVQAGRSAAMVGQSGSGKSTIIGLLERFYDPLQGAVFVDGRNLKTMNLQSVRLHIALVSQEPTLFAMSIHDNIAYGKDGATEAEIIEAARAANAHNFIRYLFFTGVSTECHCIFFWWNLFCSSLQVL